MARRYDSIEIALIAAIALTMAAPLAVVSRLIF